MKNAPDCNEVSIGVTCVYPRSVILQVQMLADENKEVRILLRRRYAGLDSPMQNKGVRFQHTLHAWHKCPQPLGVYSAAQNLASHVVVCPVHNMTTCVLSNILVIFYFQTFCVLAISTCGRRRLTFWAVMEICRVM